MESFLIHTDIQKKWIRKFKKIESEFKARAAENDIQSRFPYENIEWLIKEGYTKLTLPVEYGGEGATIEDMVILQSYLGTIDGATALSRVAFECNWSIVRATYVDTINVRFLC